MTDTKKASHTRKPLALVANNSNAADEIATAAAPVPALAPDPEPAKPVSKQAQLAALVTRDIGATLDQMIELTGWLPHTTRAALTGLKKKGYAISSDKVDGVRTYRAIAPEVA